MFSKLMLTSALGAITLASTPAFAAPTTAVTYQGTLGKTAIVLELSAPAESAMGAVAGRYFYQSKGIDIPLDSITSGGGKVDLAEEKPCTDAICGDKDGNPLAKPPVGAKWHLEANAGGSALTGTWTDDGKSLPLALTRVGTRAIQDFAGDVETIEGITDDISAGTIKLTPKTSPYDYLKLSKVAYTHSKPTTLGSTSFEYLTDPRTKFPFPRITSLGGADFTAANAYLEQQHWQISMAALSCEAQAYLGFGYVIGMGGSIGTLGSYDEEQIEVHYLSPTIMSWEQSGSTDCGGPHPDNHDDAYNLDIRKGAPLDLSLLFKGWVPKPYDDTAPKDLASARANPDQYLWAPDKALEAFLKKHYVADTDSSARLDEDCGADDLVASNTDITFAAPDKVRFMLDKLDYAIVACGGDLYTAPISELKELLTPAAADYFPALKLK